MIIRLDGWNIVRNVKPIPMRSCDWDFWHDDYDGPESGLAGVAKSPEGAILQILEIVTEPEDK